MSFMLRGDNIVSLDEPLPGAEDITRLDALADCSPYANPAWALELAETARSVP